MSPMRVSAGCLPRIKPTTWHSLTCCSLERQCFSTRSFEQPASSRASASVGIRSKARC